MPQLPTNAENNALAALDFHAFKGFSLDFARDRIAEALGHFGRYGLFEEYTKHDITHVNGMLELYDWLIPAPTSEQMTAADWLLLVLSTYLHDFGLIVTPAEYEARARCGFADYKRDVLRDQTDSGRDFAARIQKLDADRAERFLYQEFVRSHHASRVRAWISGKDHSLVGGDPELVKMLTAALANLEETFLEDLAVVCESHHLDDLDNEAKYPVGRPYGRTEQESANVQYAAILLRTADLLHITEDRVPAVSLRIINPHDPISQTEWAKQRSVRTIRSKIHIDEEGQAQPGAPRNIIEVHATFSNEDGYFGLTRYLRYAEKEIQQCFRWAEQSNRRHSVVHAYPWRGIDTENVKAKGFVAQPFQFRIDESKILELLTGHTLYNDTNVVVRELAQNSIDAVRLQRLLSPEGYAGAVTVQWDPQTRILEVSDNGTGMTLEVIENNFLRVGSSRYQEPRFQRKHPDFEPISRFGIGVLSAFMIADDVEVWTVHPDEPDARLLSLRSVHGQYLMRLYDRNSAEVPQAIHDHGTVVRLHVRDSATGMDPLAALRKWVVVPRCMVTYIEGDARTPVGYDSVADALAAGLENSGFARTDGDTFQAGEKQIQVRTVSDDGFDLAYAVSYSRWFKQWEFLKTEDRPNDHVIGTCAGGIRVDITSPGFTGANIVALANATGKAAPKTNVARSAFEATAEFATWNSKIYAAYADHVASEIDAMHSQRGFSLTRAGRDTAYLLAGVWGNDARPISAGLLDESIRRIPAFVLEGSDGRWLVSLAGLDELERVVTLFGPTSRYAEYFFEAIPGSLSLRRIFSMAGADGLFDDDIPLLSLTEGTQLTGLFRRRWEVAHIDVREDIRVLVVHWVRRAPGSERLWQNNIPQTDPMTLAAYPPLRTLLTRRSSIARGRYAYPVNAPSPALDVVLPHTASSLTILGQVYLASHHPLLKLKTAESVDEQLRLRIIATLFSESVIYGSNPELSSGYGLDLTLGSGDDWRRNLMEAAEDAGLNALVDLDSLRACLNEYQGSSYRIDAYDRRARA